MHSHNSLTSNVPINALLRVWCGGRGSENEASDQWYNALSCYAREKSWMPDQVRHDGVGRAGVNLPPFRKREVWFWIATALRASR